MVGLTLVEHTDKPAIELLVCITVLFGIGQVLA